MKSKDNVVNNFMNALKRKNGELEEIKVPHIRVMLENLIKVDEKTWGMYAFRREPLKGKFEQSEKYSLIEKANECGKEYALKIREKYNDADIYEIAKELGLEVDYPDRPNGGTHIIFAQFVEPNKITVFKDSVNKAIELIEKQELSDLFGNVNIEEILLAHEVFHYIEENDQDIFTRTEKIRLWKLGPIKNDSNIVILGEIAAMGFAKELLKLNYSPYILDVFLVYLYNPKIAAALYYEIMGI